MLLISVVLVDAQSCFYPNHIRLAKRFPEEPDQRRTALEKDVDIHSNALLNHARSTNVQLTIIYVWDAKSPLIKQREAAERQAVKDKARRQHAVLKEQYDQLTRHLKRRRSTGKCRRLRAAMVV